VHDYDAHEYGDYDFNPNPLEQLQSINVRTVNGPDDHTMKRDYYIKNDDGTETIRKTELVAKNKEPMIPDEEKTEKEKQEEEFWNICRALLGKKN
jgi:predicted component of type VI protein secretion system